MECVFHSRRQRERAIVVAIAKVCDARTRDVVIDDDYDVRLDEQETQSELAANDDHDDHDDDNDYDDHDDESTSRFSCDFEAANAGDNTFASSSRSIWLALIFFVGLCLLVYVSLPEMINDGCKVLLYQLLDAYNLTSHLRLIDDGYSATDSELLAFHTARFVAQLTGPTPLALAHSVAGLCRRLYCNFIYLFCHD